MKTNYSVTTVKIKDGVKERLKVLAIQSGTKLQDLINKILTEALPELEKQIAKKND